MLEFFKKFLRSKPSYAGPRDPIPPYVCPYCGVILNDCPKRKKMCPDCKKPIFIKYAPDDPSKQKRLVTESEADVIEKAWNIFLQRKEYLSAFSTFDIPEAKFFERKKLIREKQHREESDRDTFNAVTNEVTLDLMKKGDRDSWFTLSDIYRFKSDKIYLSGGDGLRLRIESERARLRTMKLNGFDSNKVKIERLDNQEYCHKDCSHCSPFNGKIMTIDECLKEMPVPCNDCAKDRCPNYGYSQVIDI